MGIFVEKNVMWRKRSLSLAKEEKHVSYFKGGVDKEEDRNEDLLDIPN